MKFKKKTLMSISLAAGIVMLTTSAFANYVNSSGYDDCKRALKNLLKETNYTMELDVDLQIDSDTFESVHVKQLLDTDGDVKLNLFTESSDPYSANDYQHAEYFQDNNRISYSKYSTENGTDAERYYVQDSDPDSMDELSINHLLEVDANDTETFDKAINFVEIMADMVVGDLKNNMLLIDSDDMYDTYAIDLEDYQMPEIIDAGLSLLGSAAATDFDYIVDEIDTMTIEEIANYNPFLLIGTDPVVDTAKAQVKIDNEGRIASLSGEITLSGTGYDGNTHSLSLLLALDVTDYGSTVPERIDITGKPVILSSSWRQEKIFDIEYQLENNAEELSEEEIEELNEEKAELEAEIEEIEAGNRKIDSELYIKKDGISTETVDDAEVATVEDSIVEAE